MDESDRRILAALRVDGRVSLADLARDLDIPSSTVYRRLNSLFAERRVRVAVLPLVDMDAVRLYEVRFRCQPGQQRELARKLTLRHDTRWVAVVTGDYGVAAELVVPAGTEVAPILFDDIEQSDESIIATQSSLVLHTFKGSHVSGRFPCDLELWHRIDAARHELDGIDFVVLRGLEEDGRRSYALLGTEIETSESTIRRRLSGMLEANLAAPVTIVQPAGLGFEQEAIIRLDVVPERLDTVARELAAHQGMHYLAATFGQTALICEVTMRSPAETYDFLARTVGQAEGITRMTVEAELIVMKRGFLATPWAEPAEQILEPSATVASS